MICGPSFVLIALSLFVLALCKKKEKDSSTFKASKTFRYGTQTVHDTTKKMRLLFTSVGYPQENDMALVEDYLSYEFGDFIYRDGIQGKSLRYCMRSKVHEETIGCQFAKDKYNYTGKLMKDTVYEPDLQYLNKLINNFKVKRAEINRAIHIPTADTVVVHLRLGDVVSQDDCHENKCNSYVATKSEYKIKIAAAKNNIRSSSRVVIVGFPFHLPLRNSTNNILHHLQDSKISKYLKLITRSIQYRAEIAMFFTEYFEEVEIRQLSSPDEDFAYMSSAKNFFVSGGHFSHLVADLVKLNNGYVW